MLELKNISAGYNRHLILKDVSLGFDVSSITFISGDNGSGKSALLNVLYGLLPIANGIVVMDNKVIIPNPQTMIDAGIFIVPQGKRVFRNMSVMENLEFATHSWPHRRNFPARLDEVLSLFSELQERLDYPAGNLSVYHQQMVALARCFVNKPRLILMDEPASGLLPKQIQNTFSKIQELNQMFGTGFIIAEPDSQILPPISTKNYSLHQGEIIISTNNKK